MDTDKIYSVYRKKAVLKDRSKGHDYSIAKESLLRRMIFDQPVYEISKKKQNQRLKAEDRAIREPRGRYSTYDSRNQAIEGNKADHGQSQGENYKEIDVIICRRQHCSEQDA